MQIPVVANGEIWTVADAQRCREVSGCDALMLGRGMVADPGLARAIRAADAGQPGADTVVWADLVPHLAAFWRLVCEDLEPRQRAGRLKQWLNLLRRRFAEAEPGLPACAHDDRSAGHHGMGCGAVGATRIGKRAVCC